MANKGMRILSACFKVKAASQHPGVHEMSDAGEGHASAHVVVEPTSPQPSWRTPTPLFKTNQSVALQPNNTKGAGYGAKSTASARRSKQEHRPRTLTRCDSSRSIKSRASDMSIVAKQYNGEWLDFSKWESQRYEN